MEFIKVAVTFARTTRDSTGKIIRWSEVKIFDIDNEIFDIYEWIKKETNTEKLEDLKHPITLNLLHK